MIKNPRYSGREFMNFDDFISGVRWIVVAVQNTGYQVVLVSKGWKHD